jgi:hypothetical protein
MTRFDKFTQAIKEAWDEFNEGENNDFLLVVVQRLENDKVGEIGITGYGCPACCTEILHEMVKAGEIHHHTGEKIH